MGVEYDGMSHLDRERFRYDRDRANWLDAQGWTMRYFTDRDLYRRPEYIVDSVRAALAARPTPRSCSVVLRCATMPGMPGPQIQDQRGWMAVLAAVTTTAVP